MGTAVGEIRDALDNPTYADDDEAGEWSGGRGAVPAGEVNARAGAPVPPPHSVAREGPAPPPPGGALAALQGEARGRARAQGGGGSIGGKRRHLLPARERPRDPSRARRTRAGAARGLFPAVSRPVRAPTRAALTRSDATSGPAAPASDPSSGPAPETRVGRGCGRGRALTSTCVLPRRVRRGGARDRARRFGIPRIELEAIRARFDADVASASAAAAAAADAAATNANNFERRR